MSSVSVSAVRGFQINKKELYYWVMKKAFIIVILMVVTVTLHAKERFSVQTKPLLDIVPRFQNTMLYNHGINRFWEPLVIIDLELQFSINKYLALSINPVYGQGFWKQVPMYGTNTSYAYQYWASHCLDLAAGLLYFPFGTGLRGLYVGAFPVIGWGYITHEGPVYNDYGKGIIASFVNFGYIAEAGCQLIFKNGCTISLAAGITKLFHIPKIPPIRTANNDPRIGDSYYHYGNIHGIHYFNEILSLFSQPALPFDPRIKFSIGYSF